jgi:hypothetical protein
VRHRSLKPLHLMNTIGDGLDGKTLKPRSPLQRVRRVSHGNVLVSASATDETVAR